MKSVIELAELLTWYLDIKKAIILMFLHFIFRACLSIPRINISDLRKVLCSIKCGVQFLI